MKAYSIAINSNKGCIEIPSGITYNEDVAFLEMYMQELIDGFILYYGSRCEVSSLLPDKCAEGKDFEKGFLL